MNGGNTWNTTWVFKNYNAHRPKETVFSSDPSLIEGPFKPTTDYYSVRYRRFQS